MSTYTQGVDEPTTRIGFLIWHISQATNLRGEHALARIGLTLGQSAALRVLVVSPALSSAQLARRVGVTAQTIKSAVDPLVERGLVERAPSARHGRIVELRITPAGTRLAAESQSLLADIEDDLVSRMTSNERTTITTLLTNIAAHTSPGAFPGPPRNTPIDDITREP